MATIHHLYARLALDTSTQRSLFTGSFTGITSIVLQLESNAEGTANFAIYEDGVAVKDKRVKAGESISYSPSTANSKLEFYVNYYDGTDLPRADASISL